MRLGVFVLGARRTVQILLVAAFGLGVVAACEGDLAQPEPASAPYLGLTLIAADSERLCAAPSRSPRE